MVALNNLINISDSQPDSSLFKVPSQPSQISLDVTLGTLLAVFFQSTKNFYEAGIVFPLVFLIGIFTFAPYEESAANRLVTHLLLPVLLVGASVAGYERYDMFWDHAYKWSLKQKLAPANAGSLRSFAKKQCGISESSEKLLLSSETYHAFWKNRSPMFLNYVTGWWATGTDYQQTLAKRSPGGLIASCQGVPTEMSGIIKESQGFCCASAENLKQFSRN